MSKLAAFLYTYSRLCQIVIWRVGMNGILGTPIRLWQGTIANNQYPKDIPRYRQQPTTAAAHGRRYIVRPYFLILFIYFFLL